MRKAREPAARPHELPDPQRRKTECCRCWRSEPPCLTAPTCSSTWQPAPSCFIPPTGTAYADLLIDGHRETWPIRSLRFRAWLRRRYYEATGDAPSAAALSAALNLLEAQAQFDGPERTVHVRVAEHDGHIYLDLADQAWRAVEIGPRRMAGGCGAAGALPQARRVAAAADAAAGRVARRACRRSSICRTETTLSWSRHGFWPRCAPAVPIPSW